MPLTKFIPRHSRKSFTLIELLIVIAIIAVLAATIIAATGSARKQARDARRAQDLDALKQALELYYDDYKAYPSGDLGGSNPSSIGFCIEEATGFKDALVDEYISQVPKDPKYSSSSKDYCYWYQTESDTNAQKFKLFARMEITDKNEAAEDDGGTENTCPGSGGDECMYESYSINPGSSNIDFNGGGSAYGSGLFFVTCPTGYVLVSDNPNTDADNQYYNRIGKDWFCVMKYEAKYDVDGDGKGDDAPDSCKYNTSYDTWDWNDDVDEGAGACPYSFSSENVVSTPEGSPIAGIKHSEAINACPSGTHLITNDEWMAIVRNAEQVSANWADGVIGSTVASGGGFKRGNVGINDSASYNGANPEKGTGRNEKAKLVLHNGSEIWDISGNVWEHVAFDADGDGIYGENPDDLISLQDQPEAENSDGEVRTGWGWTGFNDQDPVSSWYLRDNGSGPLNYNVFRPSNSNWDANEGMGRIYHYSNSTDTTKSRVFLRGGLWNNGAYGGAFTLSLNWGAGTQNYFVGFRCAR